MMRGLALEKNLKIIIGVLCKNYLELKICPTNAHSLNNKMEDSKIDIICISETWFFTDVSSNIYNLNGYLLFRSDRSVGDSVEYILEEIYNNSDKLLGPFLSASLNSSLR